MPAGNFEFSTTPVIITSSNVLIFEHPDAPLQAPGPFAPTVSNQLIETDQPFDIRFEWTQTAGSFWLNGGNWSFDVWLEQMGPSEASVGTGHFTGNTPAGTINGNYNFTINISANIVLPGVYRIVVAQQFHSLGQARGLAMFGDIGLVRFTTVNP